MKWPVYTEEDRKRVAMTGKQYTDEERRQVWAAFKEAAVATGMAVAKMAGQITEAAVKFSDTVRDIDKKAEERQK